LININLRENATMSKQPQTSANRQSPRHDDAAMRAGAPPGENGEVATRRFTTERSNLTEEEADAAEHAAMQQGELDGITDNQITGNDPNGPAPSTGIRARRVMTMKAFLPDADWIVKNVVVHGRGTHVSVGRLYGKAARSERTTKMWQDKQLTSVRIEGMFEAIGLITGEVTRCTTVYLPLAFAEQVEMALLTNPGSIVDMDVDIGLEATGNAIPHEWTVTSYIDGAAERAMRAMRNRRPTSLSPEVLQRLSLSAPTGTPN
jgi:hypothetical protein